MSLEIRWNLISTWPWNILLKHFKLLLFCNKSAGFWDFNVSTHIFFYLMLFFKYLLVSLTFNGTNSWLHHKKGPLLSELFFFFCKVLCWSGNFFVRRISRSNIETFWASDFLISLQTVFMFFLFINLIAYFLFYLCHSMSIILLNKRMLFNTSSALINFWITFLIFF